MNDFCHTLDCPIQVAHYHSARGSEFTNTEKIVAERDVLRAENTRLQAELTNAKHFIETLRAGEAQCNAENKNVHVENMKLEMELAKLTEDHKWLRRNYEEEKMLVSDYTDLKKTTDTYRAGAEGMAVILKGFTEIHDVPEYGHACRKDACSACKAEAALAAWSKLSGEVLG